MFSIESDVFVSTPDFDMRNVKIGDLSNAKGKYFAMTRYGEKYFSFTPIVSVDVKTIEDECYRIRFVNTKGLERELVVTSDQRFFTRCKGYVEVSKIGISDIILDSEGYPNRLVSRERIASDDHCFCELRVDNNSNAFVNDILVSCHYEDGRSERARPTKA